MPKRTHSWNSIVHCVRLHLWSRVFWSWSLKPCSLIMYWQMSVVMAQILVHLQWLVNTNTNYSSSHEAWYQSVSGIIRPYCVIWSSHKPWTIQPTELSYIDSSFGSSLEIVVPAQPAPIVTRLCLGIWAPGLMVAVLQWQRLPFQFLAGGNLKQCHVQWYQSTISLWHYMKLCRCQMAFFIYFVCLANWYWIMMDNVGYSSLKNG